MTGVAKTLFFLSICIASGAHASIYVCKDASGRTYTSDRPIPECADRVMRVYGANGVLKKEISPPLTAEQKREMQLRDEQKKIELAAAEERAKADRALSARYRSEEDVAAARKREVDVVNDQIIKYKKTLATATAEWQETQTAVELQRKKGVVPAGMQDKLDRADQTVRNLRIKIMESETELAKVHAKYDAILQRYREMTAVSAR